MRTRNPSLVGVALVLLLALAGCKSSGTSQSTQTPDQRLAAAKKTFDDATYIGFKLTTPALPDDVLGLIEADGTGTHAPAFTGEVKVHTKVTDITAPLISVSGTVYAKLPIIGWKTIDPASYGAPDPANLMSTDNGLSSLFTDTQDAKAGATERDGSTVLTDIDGTLAGSDVKTVFPSAGTSDFKVTYKLTDDNKVEAAVMTGPFYNGFDDVTYTMTFNLDASSVDIKAPS